MNEPDVALVLRSQQRDRSAFEQLVHRTARLVYSRIYLDVRDSHRTEELVQETFLVAWKSIAQVSEPAGFRTWLLSVARSVTVDSLRNESRKKRSGRRTDDPGAVLRVADSLPTPPESLEREEERQQVLAVLAALPEEYREPLALRYIAGADYETIGRQLGLSNGSLRGLLSRGMAKLRERMNQGGAAPGRRC